MKLLFLGVFSAFSVGDATFQSNMLIESESGTKLLIDCGSDARHSLFAQGYRHKDIDAVYISHLHSDHVGGLEWLGFCKRFIDGQKPTLYISADQSEKLWNNVLSGGMSSLEGEKATLASYFNINAISNNYFIWENYLFELIKTYHYVCNAEILPSYGLLIDNALKKIFITTDTRFSPDNLQEVYNKADIIFHDCETTPIITGQHAHYNDLKTLDKKTKQKIWLYDYNEGKLPDAQKDGFQGFVVRGQRFNF
jgi:ribonuclease BN (tRNA processing enzyme)